VIFIKKIKTKCVICKKRFTTRSWKSKLGDIKCNVIGTAFCSKKCRKRFKLIIILNDILDALDKLE